MWLITPLREALDYLWRSGFLIKSRDKMFNKVYRFAGAGLSTRAESFADMCADMCSETQSDRQAMIESYRELIVTSLGALGIASIAEIADYFRPEKLW